MTALVLRGMLAALDDPARVARAGGSLHTLLARRTRTNASLRSEVRHHSGRLLTTAVGVYAIFARR